MTNPIAGLGTVIRRESATEQAAAVLREAIVSGRIPPGTPLREAALGAELGVSRNTIREAARLLSADGLVRYQMNRGIIVSEITSGDVTDIYTARAAIETAGADALTAHRDSALYQKLAGLVDQIENAFARGDVAGVLEGDQQFHATLVAATASPRLSRFHTQLQQDQRLALSLAEHSSRQLGRTADDHRVLLQALHGTPAQARAQLAAHLQAGAAELQRLRELLTMQN